MRVVLRIAVLALIAVSRGVHGESLEEAAAGLGDDRFDIREKAEQTLLAGGAGAIAIVESLASSDDPEVAARARRIHSWIVCGLDGRIPPELAADLVGYDQLPEERQLQVPVELAALAPPHAVALAHLHGRLFNPPFDEAARNRLLGPVEQQLRSALSKLHLSLEDFVPDLLGARTRALLINRTCLEPVTAEQLALYSTWLEFHPDLRGHLDARGVQLELKRLRKTWNKRDALVFLSEIADEPAFQVAAKDLREWMLGDPTLSIEDLKDAEAIGYLELSFGGNSPGDALVHYKRLRERIPNLAGRLRPSRETALQALHLWEAGDYSGAIRQLLEDEARIRVHASHLSQMMSGADRDEIIAEFDRIPVSTRFLEELMTVLMEQPTPGRIEQVVAVSACLRGRADRNHNTGLKLKESQTLALNIWQADRSDLCYLIMEEAFWTGHDADDWRLSVFPALAAALGRLDRALASAESQPATSRHRELKHAYLQRAAGKLDQALRLSCSVPDSPLHQLLLLEARDWPALAASKHQSRLHQGWYACLNGDIAPGGRGLPGPGEASSYLRLLTGDHAGLFRDALNSGGAGVSGDHYARVLAGDLLLRELREGMVDARQGDGNRSGGGSALPRGQPPRALPKPAKPARPNIRIKKPEIGTMSDPKAAEFAILDGVARVADLSRMSREQDARSLMRNIMLRLILDEALESRPVTTSILEGRMIASGSAHSLELLMIGLAAMEIPADIALTATRITSLIQLDPRTAYINKKRLHWTARAFASHGDFDHACRSHHRFCSRGLTPKFHYHDIGTTAYLIELEIRRSFAHGDHREALAIYLRHHRVLDRQAAGVAGPP